MTTQREIVFRSSGHGGGPFRRLMSPGDLGQHLKPFVFLDLFEFPGGMRGGGGLHPHSGIATVTLFVRGQMHFDDDASGQGTIEYGGVEFVVAGEGIWHGRELSPGSGTTIQGFQLWLALPPELETAAPTSFYREATAIPEVGPARVILGNCDGVESPLPGPDGVTYLLVSLEPGQSWTFNPESGQAVGWAAVSSGKLAGKNPVETGEIAVFAPGDQPIEFVCDTASPVTFVLGAAKPHPYPLCLGNYSVHTSAAALQQGENRIRVLGEQISRQPPQIRSGAIPVVR